jgi:hypothetical protein
MSRFSFVPLCAMPLIALPLVAAREPTQLEQYYLELVNRARANPEGEVSRLAGQPWGDEGSPAPADLDEGLAPGTISPAPKPPLAFDTRLVQAASAYSDHLLATEQFSHTAQGTAHSRMHAAGYVFTPPSSSGENLAITASNGPHPINAARIEQHHEGLFIDFDVTGRGHRINLLDPGFREIGIAIRADSNGLSYFGGAFNDVLSTQKFARSAGRTFVTGVIYHDHNSNGHYDPGESAGILALSVRNGANATVASGTSFGSGGYSINLHGLPGGSYTLVARDALGAEASVAFFWGGAANVKADIIDPAFLSLPVLGIERRPDSRIGRNAAAPLGNNIYSNNASGQALRQVARSAGTHAWHALVENDGSGPDQIRTSGSRGNRFFRAIHLRRSGGVFANETASLATGLIESLESGEAAAYRIRVTPLRPSLGRRTDHVAFLRSASVAAPARIDRVNAVLVSRTRRMR